MSTDAEMSDRLWGALDALPRPVSVDQVSAAAASILDGKRASDFASWLESNAAYLLGRLNG